MNAAMSAAARIAWHAEPAPQPVGIERWVSVCFLPGDDAEEVLQMIDQEGIDAALGYVKNWDYGDETTHAALENGHVYDHLPTGSLEHEVRDDNYVMN